MSRSAALVLRLLLAGGALLLGLALGRLWQPTPAAALAGGGLALAACLSIFLAQDAWRTRRLLRWIARPEAPELPQIPGDLGELAQRMGLALQRRDRRLASEQQRLAQLLSAMEASPMGVLLLNEQEQIQWLNKTAAEHFGLDMRRDLEQRLTNLVRSPVFVDYLHGRDFSQPVTLSSPAGGALLSVTLSHYGSAMKLLLSQDITERERHDLMRRDFVANVSHEIRSPLTVLGGFIETLGELPLDARERQQVLALMAQQTQRMQALVSDLLNLAQIEGAPRPSANEWIAVQQLLQRLESDARALDAGRHALQFGGSVPAEISAIESELYSAVWNLLSNALRYTPEGGSVCLRWELLADGGARFSVRDDGPGIAREHLPRLTERFYRVDGSRSRATGGTGLGLAIVKHVVQRHGGSLEISSQPGRGSEFALLLPAHRVRRAPLAGAAPTQAHAQALAADGQLDG